jgi:hypothetical protein
VWIRRPCPQPHQNHRPGRQGIKPRRSNHSTQPNPDPRPDDPAEKLTFSGRSNYRHGETRAGFEQLAQRLNVTFGHRCYVDRDVQDASLHGSIVIPADATAWGYQLVVSISNFGGLAALTVDHPGAWTEAETATMLSPVDSQGIGTALADLGYTLIPEEPLRTPYDGAADPESLGRTGTWWNRYFDYL